jgi:hypothetical protein
VYGWSRGRELIDDELDDALLDELLEELLELLLEELLEELLDELEEELLELFEDEFDDELLLIGCDEPPQEPPAAISSSSSVNSMAPAGFSGSSAKSSSLRLVRNSGSFHARIIRSRSMHVPPLP